MTGKIPTDVDILDKQQRQHKVAAANLPEAWPIAHIAAYKEIIAPLTALHDSLVAGTAASTSPTSIQNKIMEIIEQINALTLKRWSEYVKAATLHPLQAESLKKAGVPEHITYDPKDGFPFLTWLTVTDGPQLNWTQIEVKIAEDKSGQLFVLTPPFRPIDLECLPAGTQQLRIADPVHAATIAVYEVMDAALLDLTRAKASVSARDNWVRMRCVASFYTSIVKERMKELALDDYKDWVVTLPAQIPIMNAPAVIARHGSNAVVIQLLALRTVANFLLDCLDRTENEPGNHDQAMMVDQVLDEMNKYHERIRMRFDSLNSLLISEGVDQPELFFSQVISRPMPRGTPLIALIPLDSAPKLSNLTDIRGQ